ncbi:hypothetical protein [Clostridium magnum]|uniref:Uncharacterized protein n=1 Tax=Clostridium magnum DSM 2767 TaxID=1121326 RepID=A0A162R9G1_9CLOT|nr:hypothetical protein [Clostridium magnum]KZL89590.1 hypothetical protein CLMAG_50900 [Clostridium magnum DSM 2767]SHH73424.1 hypothetical protein SAMN02745944_01274 [Clostridium magnum DSM 2767]
MKISSNYYDYYNQIYQLNSLSNTQINSDFQIDNDNSSLSEDKTKAINFIQTRNYIPDENVDIANLNYSGTMVANSLRMQSVDTSEMSESIEKLNTDLDSLKTTDIDSMSADEAKELLIQLQIDMSSIKSLEGEANDISDIDSISESDIKDMLKNIQENANNMAAPPQNTKEFNVFSKIDENMESLKDVDIDSISVDDAKELLTQLQTDMAPIKNPYGGSSSSQKMDIDSMTESDVKDMLKKIQEYANKMTIQTEDDELSDTYNKVKEDIDTIRTADIDNMSADEVKSVLTQLKNDTESISSEEGQADDIYSIDIDSMSESDIKDILKKIQQQANDIPMMGRFYPSQMPNHIEKKENYTSTIDSDINA